MFPVLLTLTCILILAFLVWASASIKSGVYLKAFCRAKTADKVVYLTFDDGPAGAETEAVLDVLKTRGAVATFFIIGKNVTGQEPLLRRILTEGHLVGIHTLAMPIPFLSIPRGLWSMILLSASLSWTDCPVGMSASSVHLLAS